MILVYAYTAFPRATSPERVYYKYHHVFFDEAMRIVWVPMLGLNGLKLRQSVFNLAQVFAWVLTAHADMAQCICYSDVHCI
jgi:hypothetical protein